MLTDEQIAIIDQFCLQKGVYYYDLRMELVDHLSESIEETMAADPTNSFDETLVIVYNAFGSAGFSHLVDERRNSITRNYKKEYWQLIHRYFGLPRILLSIGLLVFAFIPVLMIPAIDTQLNYALWFMLLPVLFHIFQQFYFRYRFKQSSPLIALYGLNWKPYVALFLLYNLYRVLLFISGRGFAEVKLTVPLLLVIGVIFLIFELGSFNASKKQYLKAVKNYPLAFKK